MQNKTSTKAEARRKPKTHDQLDLTEISSYRLSRHNKLMRKGRDAEAMRLGLTIDEWRLLLVLRRQGPQPSIRLAEAALMDRGTVSRSVARMEKRGLVYRLSDAADGRIAIVNLTETGSQKAAAVYDFMMSREMDLISTLTDEEWRAWLDITQKFYERLKSVYGDD